MIKLNPPNTAALQAWLVSQGYALWSIVVFAVAWGVTNGLVHDWTTFFMFLKAASFSVFIALVFGIGPYARGLKASTQVSNTVPLQGGGSAILQPTVAPPSPQAATATLVSH